MTGMFKVPDPSEARGNSVTAREILDKASNEIGKGLAQDLEVQSQMTGSGPLMVLRNGVAVTGTWKRASLNDPTTLTASNGSTIALQPGQTWVEIVPSTVAVTTTSPTPSTTKASTRRR